MKFIVFIFLVLIKLSFAQSPLKLYDKNGNKISFPKDKLIILNFMAYSCGHCMAEIPVFKKVLSKPEYADKFVIYGFAIDGKENNFKDKQFPIYSNNLKNNVVFPVMGTPTTYIVDFSGKKLEIIYGSITEKKLEQFLKESLKKHK